MVELRVDILEELGLPNDCFVSVRIGEMQKLSRLAPKRIYRFPKSYMGDAERRYGKIEVFQRIGSSSVGIDPITQGGEKRNITVSCNEAGFGSLQLQVEVAGQDGEGQQECRLQNFSTDVDLVAKASKGTQATKVKVAKDYLAKHGLEAKLSKVMQAVLRELPADPSEFIAFRLLHWHSVDQGRPHTVPTQSPPSVAAPPTQGRASLPRPQSGKLVPVQQAVNDLDHLRSPWSSLPVPVLSRNTDNLTVLPLADYYITNFRSMSADAWIRLHSKFPPQALPDKCPASSSDSVPVNASYHTSFRSMGTDAWFRIYPAFLSPEHLAGKIQPSQEEAYGSPSVDDLRAFARIELSSALGEGPEFCRRELEGPVPPSPSVGTWALPLPIQEKRIPPNSFSSFVGGSLQRRADFSCETPVENLRRHALECLLDGLASGLLETTMSQMVKAQVVRMPSVGSWSLPLPVHEVRKVAWHSMPSVGT